MGKKHVVVATLDQRLFVKEILRLGKLGAELDESFPVHKSGFMRATLQVDETVDVGENAVLKVFTIKDEENTAKEAPKEPTEAVEEAPKAKPRVARKTAQKSPQEDKSE